MKDYRITVKVRNNRILKAIEEVGSKLGVKWCDDNGLCYASVNKLINMTAGPISSCGKVSLTAKKLCDVLNKIPEDLWSHDQLYPLEKNFSTLEMSHEEVMAFLPNEGQSCLPDYSDFENEQRRKIIDKALEKLTPRERQVIHMFYDEYTLEQSGKVLGVSQARVKQIFLCALKKLKDPKIARIYVDCIDDGLISDEYRAELKSFSVLDCS